MELRLIKKENYKYISWGIALLACTLIFIAIEIRYPYYFLRDDNADSYLAEYTYGINCISSGRFPFYCFNEFGGQRFFASGQTGIFNPLVYFAFMTSNLICGKPDMLMDILAYLSIRIGCTGAFFLLKKLGCSDLPAIIGAIAWNFNAYNIWEGTSWMIIIYTTSVFPVILLTSLRLLERPGIPSLVLAILPRVYLFYLGHPQFFIFAAFFDCIFIGVLCLIRNDESRLFKLLMLVKDYLIVYLSTTFLSLPLLIPEYQYTQMVTNYSSAGTLEQITSEMWFDKTVFFVPFLYTEDNYCFFYPPFIGYLLTAFVIIGCFLLILLFMDRSDKKLKTLWIGMAASIPCIILGGLLLFSSEALRIISYIPILNRFQYYHRLNVFFSAFMIIFACLSVTTTGCILGRKFKQKLEAFPKIRVIVKGVVLVSEVLVFALLYTLTPHMGRGPIYDTSRLYDFDYASQFTGGRYVTAGYITYLDTINRDKYDLSENLNYNLAKLYGINNISGYAGVLNYVDVIRYNECFQHMYAITGSFYEYYPGMVEQMREQSVCWYIINPQNRSEYEAEFLSYGMEYVSETEHSVIYYDPYAQPYAYDLNRDEVSLTQDINSLVLKTDSDFPGSKITLNYAYDPNFRCYIDGKPAAIYDEPTKWQYHIECTPGEHEIIIQYEDPTFVICCMITAEYVVLAGIAAYAYKKIRERRLST